MGRFASIRRSTGRVGFFGVGGDMTRSETTQGNQNAVKPETGGGLGARRALYAGKPFSLDVAREIVKAARVLELSDGEVDLLSDLVATVAGVERKFRKAVFAAGDRRKKKPMQLAEYTKQWVTLAGLESRLLLALHEIRVKRDDGVVDVSKYREPKR